MNTNKIKNTFYLIFYLLETSAPTHCSFSHNIQNLLRHSNTTCGIKNIFKKPSRCKHTTCMINKGLEYGATYWLCIFSTSLLILSVFLIANRNLCGQLMQSICYLFSVPFMCHNQSFQVIAHQWHGFFPLFPRECFRRKNLTCQIGWLAQRLKQISHSAATKNISNFFCLLYAN